MPCLTHVDPALRMGMVRAIGYVSGADLARANEALYSDPAWVPGFDEFWDCSGIVEFDVSPEEMRAIADMEVSGQDRIGPGRVALVMTREVVQMVGILYRAMVTEAARPVEIVLSLEAGAAWLGHGTCLERLRQPHEGAPASGPLLSAACKRRSVH